MAFFVVARSLVDNTNARQILFLFCDVSCHCLIVVLVGVAETEEEAIGRGG
jgi:hypothetical protein